MVFFGFFVEIRVGFSIWIFSPGSKNNVEF